MQFIVFSKSLNYVYAITLSERELNKMISYTNPSMKEFDRKRLEDLYKKIIPKEKLGELLQLKEIVGCYCNAIDSPLGLFKIKTCDISSIRISL
jgi:hypothetical protein